MIEKGSSRMRRLAVRASAVALMGSVAVGGVPLGVLGTAYAQPPAQGQNPDDAEPKRFRAVVDESGHVWLYLDGKLINPSGEKAAQTLGEVAHGLELPRDSRHEDPRNRVFPSPKDPKVEAGKSWREVMGDARKRKLDLAKAFAKDGPGAAQGLGKYADATMLIEMPGKGLVDVPVTNGMTLADAAKMAGAVTAFVAKQVEARDSRAVKNVRKGKIDHRTNRQADAAPSAMAEAWQKEAEARRLQRDAGAKKRAGHADADSAAERAKVAQERAQTARDRASRNRDAFVRKSVSEAQGKFYEADEAQRAVERLRDQATRQLMDAEQGVGTRGEADARAQAGKARDQLRELEPKAARAQQEAKRLRGVVNEGTEKAKLDLLKQARNQGRPDGDPPAVQAKPTKPGPRTPSGTGAQRPAPAEPVTAKTTTSTGKTGTVGKSTSTRTPTGKVRTVTTPSDKAATTPSTREVKTSVADTPTNRPTGKAGRVPTPDTPTGKASSTSTVNQSTGERNTTTTRGRSVGAGPAKAGLVGSGLGEQGVVPRHSGKELHENPDLPIAYGLAENLHTVGTSGTYTEKRWYEEMVRNNLTDPRKRATFQKALQDIYQPQILPDGKGSYVNEAHPIRQKWEKYIEDTYGPKTDPDQAKDAMIADKKMTSDRATIEQKRDKARDVLGRDKGLTLDGARDVLAADNKKVSKKTGEQKKAAQAREVMAKDKGLTPQQKKDRARDALAADKKSVSTPVPKKNKTSDAKAGEETSTKASAPKTGTAGEVKKKAVSKN